MTSHPSDDCEESLTAATLAALAMLGYSGRDCLCLHFSFEAPSLRQAVELASELRTVAGSVVQVRPAWSRPRSPRRWMVMLKTPPTAVEVGAFQRWESLIEGVARLCPSCRLVGWIPLLDVGNRNRILLGPDCP